MWISGNSHAQRSCVCLCALVGLLPAPSAVHSAIAQKPDGIRHSATCPPVIEQACSCTQDVAWGVCSVVAAGDLYGKSPEANALAWILMWIVLVALVVSAGRATLYRTRGQPIEEKSITNIKWVAAVVVLGGLYWGALDLALL